MKKKVSVLLIMLLCFSLSFSQVYGREPERESEKEKSIYGEYDSFKELYDAYTEAVAAGDVEKQNELIEIGRTSLDKEIEMSEKLSLRYDPDEMYWKRQFPTYFHYGYFEYRSSGWTLSLGPKLTYWTGTDKANGWNAVYAKFHNNTNWANTSVMKDQFYCHARLGYAYFAGEWNLEPWRTSMNPITCN